MQWHNHNKEDSVNLIKFYDSVVYKNMLKALVYYYSDSNSGHSRIRKISFYFNDELEARFEFDEEVLQFDLVEKERNDLFGTYKTLPNSELILGKEKKELTYFRAVLYWLQARAESKKFYTFERLWKAFNIIYNFYNSGKNKDADGLDKIIYFIRRNLEKFSDSLSMLKNKEVADFRWKKMKANYVSRVSKPEKKEELKNEIDDLLKNSIDNGRFIENGIEEKPLKLFLRYYCYFVRCSFFHGGYNDEEYNLFTNSRYDKELMSVNRYLSCLIYELLCAL